jgi:uncharacterized protein YehS (DUF1456 family)
MKDNILLQKHRGAYRIKNYDISANETSTKLFSKPNASALHRMIGTTTTELEKTIERTL